MKLVRVRLRNFRCYKKEISIDLSSLTAFIGKNDSGKSSILDALDIFFNDSKIDQDDASKTGDANDVRITCEFENLPKSLIVDVDYETNLKQEYLLNKENRLEISKLYNCELKTIKPKVFANAFHPTAQDYNDLLLLKNAELKTRANQLGIDLSSVDQRKNAQLRKLIWEHAKDLSLGLKEIPLDGEAFKQIWEPLRKYLPVLALFKSDRPSTDQDAEAQDPMKAAVKEALKSQEKKLDEISKYVEKEVRAIADSTVEKIREMDPNLASQLSPRFTPPNWANVFKISLTGDDEIPINKRGSGVRRLILLNFFRAKAEQKAMEQDSTGIIYCIEEPETSQHPNNQRMLIEAFAELSEQPGCQVILSTHTPVLTKFIDDRNLRYVCINEDGTRSIIQTTEETNRQIAKSLGIIADHNIKEFIGVEGKHDIDFLKVISTILNKAGEDIPDLEKEELEGRVMFVPVGGSNLALWTLRLQKLNRPEFHLMDRDTQPPAKPHYHSLAESINQRNNATAWTTNKKELENYIHPDAIRSFYPNYVGTGNPFEDVPLLTAQGIHEASTNPNKCLWSEIEKDPDNIGKKKSQAKHWLNTKAVSLMTPELLTKIDTDNEIRTWLSQIGRTLRES
jgi:predicted ATP-dependent endonuclease of OLD family